ncbi:NADP-dependent oxidoreductase [Actinoplanes ianthinogenes]|uniref:NADP-dependent oxidoreductase n=1 Tax=Actinoplanes ianthinogenes TaxID=122358 RepID=A0ABM7M8F9_9ACTN|nr:NADP-dependent oxidoreductase [Actinoplanes ianthinogenes]BCJ47926.1 NADP-dependent oxidoreductase [Actinoplanes ianthinogenes]GGR05138.1 NADP-dependent oxidoreductase [Actinoplanes ianthinogenes]
MREIRVAPTGEPAVVRAGLPEPGPGEVLVRNRWFTVFAALRTLLAGGVPGAPLPALRPGDTLFGPAIGEIVGGPDAGALVRHMRGWREYAAVPVSEIDPVSPALPDPVAHFAQGTTAYGALTRAAPIRPGDTVFVSGGAGSVGTMAGQIARLLGAGRVVGSTGSAWKAERMRELGYDAVVTRPLDEQLAKAAPDGVDVLFDNVGGGDLRAAIAAANRSARFALVGALSGQLAQHGSGTTGPVEIDSYQVILKQITMTGYSAGGDAEVRAEWDARFAEWLSAGRIEFPHVLVDGIEQAPQALRDVWAGRHFGTVVVTLT